jgi:hypothetical protein
LGLPETKIEKIKELSDTDVKQDNLFNTLVTLFGDVLRDALHNKQKEIDLKAETKAERNLLNIQGLEWGKYERLANKLYVLPQWSMSAEWLIPPIEDKELIGRIRIQSYSYDRDDIRKQIKEAKKEAEARGNRLFSELLDKIKIYEIDKKAFVLEPGADYFGAFYKLSQEVYFKLRGLGSTEVIPKKEINKKYIREFSPEESKTTTVSTKVSLSQSKDLDFLIEKKKPSLPEYLKLGLDSKLWNSKHKMDEK